MAAIDDWLAHARTDRQNTLIYYNFLFEQAQSQVRSSTLTWFDRFLSNNSGKILTYKSSIREFIRQNNSIKLSGSNVDFPSAGLVAVFSANKAGRVLGLSPTFREILSGIPDSAYDSLPDASRPAIPDASRQRAARLIEGTIKKHLAAFRRTTRAPVPPIPPTGTGRRATPARQTRGLPFDKYVNPSEAIWVTSKAAARPLYQKRTAGPDVALTMRRLLGLPTVHSISRSTTSIDDFLFNLLFRVHFKKRAGLPPIRVDMLHKPTVFSGGIDEVYGAYWSKPRANGWGCTITLCAGDRFDGSEGLPEALISLADLECTHIISLGRIDRENAPGLRHAQVDVGIFTHERHEVCLGMTCA
jgi:hypothetical protein